MGVEDLMKRPSVFKKPVDKSDKCNVYTLSKYMSKYEFGSPTSPNGKIERFGNWLHLGILKLRRKGDTDLKVASQRAGTRLTRSRLLLTRASGIAEVKLGLLP